MEQLSPEWFSARAGRITGSRVAAAIGASPWRTREDLIRQMVREHHGAPSEHQDNPATMHGRLHEQQALLSFMKKTGLTVEQCGFFPYGDHYGASPDGLTSDGGIMELKVPFSLRNEKAAEFKPLSEQVHYWHQVQMEMIATGRYHAYFVQYVAQKGDVFGDDYVEEQIHIERIERDPAWWPSIEPRLEAFLAELKTELDNPAHLEPLRQVIDTEEALGLVEEYDRLQKERKSADARMKEIIAELAELAGDKDADIGGRKLTKVVRKGSVSYARAIKDLAPDADLEKYRGKESTYWRLT